MHILMMLAVCLRLGEVSAAPVSPPDHDEAANGLSIRIPPRPHFYVPWETITDPVSQPHYASCLASPSKRITKPQIKPSHALGSPLWRARQQQT